MFLLYNTVVAVYYGLCRTVTLICVFDDWKCHKLSKWLEIRIKASLTVNDFFILAFFQRATIVIYHFVYIVQDSF